MDLELTYPGCEEDIKQVKDWLIQNVDKRKNSIIFHEVIEGMLDQEQIYLGWEYEHSRDHYVEEEEDSCASRFFSRSAGYGIEKPQSDCNLYGLDFKKIDEMEQCCDSILNSLDKIAKRKKI